jgi:hypothetical protein
MEHCVNALWRNDLNGTGKLGHPAGLSYKHDELVGKAVYACLTFDTTELSGVA